MTPEVTLSPVSARELELTSLPLEASREGFRFVQRLIDDWRSGENRFDQPGEQLLGAFSGHELVAVCGLNRDPYVDGGGVARLRHLYVVRSMRRRGIASALLKRLLGDAKGVFEVVRLRTDNDAAAAFYMRHGFDAVAFEDASHVMSLDGS